MWGGGNSDINVWALVKIATSEKQFGIIYKIRKVYMVGCKNLTHGLYLEKPTSIYSQGCLRIFVTVTVLFKIAQIGNNLMPIYRRVDK